MNCKAINKMVVLFFNSILLLVSGPAFAKWDVQENKDEMTGDFSAYATSESVGPTKDMGFPYRDTKAWLGVGCKSNSQWIYVGFSSAPNLSDTQTMDNYNLITTRVKFDSNEPYQVQLTQNWGASFLHFQGGDLIILEAEKFNSMLLELNWYGEGKKYFKFSLKGASAAIRKIREKCKKNSPAK